ncbi:MAG: helix-turn-helix domain-containing protein [Thiogranum sp.]|nr:helix-turn-helix domain-containing protein [Thiogranum sp.]
MHVSILAFREGLSSTVIGPLEIFRNAGVVWNALLGQATQPVFDVSTVSRDGKPVRFDGGITIIPDKSVTQVRKTDLVIIPAVGLDTDRLLSENRHIIRWLQRQADKGTVIAGACSGVAFMAEAGLLEQREATTHWALAESFRERYPNVDWHPERFITESDNIFCGGGVYAALDLSLHLVERFAGYEVSRQCGRALLIDAPRVSQAGYGTTLVHRQHNDEKIQQAQDYMQDYYNAQFTMDELAQRMGMSTRNFLRRFKQATNDSPLTYLHKLRTSHAKRLLETDFKSVQEICFEVGYEDVPFFRRIFKRYAGVSPREYRQRFGAR